MIEYLLVYLLISISISHMWSHADIFITLRNKVAKIPYIRRPLICPECFSFWVGFGVSFLYNPLATLTYVFVSNVLCGLVTYLFADTLYKKGIVG